MLESTAYMSDCTMNSARGTGLKYIYIYIYSTRHRHGKRKTHFPNVPIIRTFFNGGIYVRSVHKIEI